MKNEKGYWTKEKCQEEALKYSNRTEFGRNSYAYQLAKKNGWIDEVCSHMLSFSKKRGYWTKEKCKENAIKCLSRIEFQTKYPSAYIACRRNRWLDEVCSHLKGYKQHGYWTKENCAIEALKYKTRNEFRKGSSWSYRISCKNDWLNDICLHMKVIGNSHKRCIYSYEFSDNYVYIGLTGNIDKRIEIHNKKGSVFNHKKITSTFNFQELTSYIPVDEAKLLENEFLQKYKKEGWKILNKIKTGGIGSTKKWTKEKCRKEALKYKTKKEFEINSNAYKASCRYGWLNEICSHMITKKIWTKENCKKEALKYETRKKFEQGNSNAYQKARKKGWLNEICSHMKMKSNEYWDYDKCKEESLKYRNKTEFKNKNNPAYRISKINNWLNEFF